MSGWPSQKQAFSLSDCGDGVAYWLSDHRSVEEDPDPTKILHSLKNLPDYSVRPQNLSSDINFTKKVFAKGNVTRYEHILSILCCILRNWNDELISGFSAVLFGNILNGKLRDDLLYFALWSIFRFHRVAHRVSRIANIQRLSLVGFHNLPV